MEPRFSPSIATATLWGCLAVGTFFSTLPACGDGGSTPDDGSASGASETAATTTAEPAGVDYETDVQPVWDTWCLCHQQGPDGSMEASTMTLNAGRSIADVVGVAAVGAPGLVRVEPGSPERSYVWRKLTNTHADVGGAGEAMPPGGVLEDDVLAVVEAWIAEGARP